MLNVHDDVMSSTDSLTLQQRRALRLVALGLNDKLIAVHLGVAERTVRFHISQAIRRLGAANRSHAIALAVGRGEIAGPTQTSGKRPALEPSATSDLHESRATVGTHRKRDPA